MMAGLAFGACLALGLAALAQDDAPPPPPEPNEAATIKPALMVTGTEEHLWLVHRVDGDPALLHRHRRFDPNTLYEVCKLDRMPAAIAAQENDLYLVDPDGSMFGIGYVHDPPQGTSPYAPTTHPRLPLAQGERLIDLAAGRRQVHALIAGPTTDEAPHGSLRLLAKAGLDWQPVELPPSLNAADAPAMQIIPRREDVLTLAYRAPEQGKLMLDSQQPEGWRSKSYRLAAPPQFQLVVAIQHAVAIFRDGDVWQVHALREGKAVPLACPPSQQIGNRTLRATGRGEWVDLILMNGEGELAHARIDPRAPAGAAPPIHPLTAKPRPAQELEFGQAVMIAALMAMTFLMLYNWKRDPKTGIVRLPAQWQACDLPRRVLAAWIDMAPALLVGWLISGLEHPLAVTENWPVFGGDWEQWRPAVFTLGTFLVHTTIGEMFSGTSLGKACMRCRIVTNHGRPPDLWQVLMRNALKLLEVILLFPLVLIVLTPFKQRLGDLIARTVVVCKAEPRAEQKDEQDHSEI